MDQYHGQGGTYEVDPVTNERTLKVAPTQPTDSGGARDSDGNPILEQQSDKPEPALPLSAEAREAAIPLTGNEPVEAQFEATAEQAPAAQPQKKGA